MMSTPNFATPSVQESECPVGLFHQDVDLFHLSRARGGDRNALTPLWQKYHPCLRDYFGRRTHSAEEAEDLASETLCAAFSQLNAFRGKPAPMRQSASTEPASPRTLSGTFRSYLFTIAHHQWAGWIRRKKLRPTTTFSEFDGDDNDSYGRDALSQRLPADSCSDPLQLLLSREKDDVACYALADIGMRSEDQFKAMLLHYACDISHKEIAVLLRTPQKTINSRLQEARESLRKRLEPNGDARLSLSH